MALKLFIKRFLGHCGASGHCARHVSTELATSQPQMGGGLFTLRRQGGFSSLLCPHTKKLCPVHRPQSCPWEAVNAETRNPQPILSSVLTTVTDAKHALHRSNNIKRAVCSCFCLSFWREERGQSQAGGKSRQAHLHKGELLLAGVVVAGGALILLGVVGAILVGVLVRRVHKFPRVLVWSERRGSHMNATCVTAGRRVGASPSYPGQPLLRAPLQGFLALTLSRTHIHLHKTTQRSIHATSGEVAWILCGISKRLGIHHHLKKRISLSNDHVLIQYKISV